MAKGIDVRATFSELIFRALLEDSSGNLVTSGTTLLRLYEIQYGDGSLKGYDFATNVFTTAALQTETENMLAQVSNNGNTATGIWTYRLATLTGFTPGNIYIAHITNTAAFPVVQAREFQFGGDQGDLPMLYGKVDGSTFAPTAGAFETNITNTTEDFCENAFLLFLSPSALAGVTGRVVLTYQTPANNPNGKGKITGLLTPFPSAPASGDRFAIIGANS